MNQTQFQTISNILANLNGLSEDDQIIAINEALDIDITDREKAKALKEAIIGYDTMEITVTPESISVSFGGITADAKTFGIAFITTLTFVINAKAIAKFLPEPQQPKTASSSKRDGAGSPAPTRSLPIRGGNY